VWGGKLTLNAEPRTFFCFFFFTLFSIIANSYLNFGMLYTIDIVEQKWVVLRGPLMEEGNWDER